MQQTTNLKFNKIELTDSPPDITVLNSNFDKIDAELYPTIDPSVTPSGNVGFAKALLGGLANRIKAITGKTNWWDSPTKSLEQLNTDKVDKVTGKGLSTNDYANVDKEQVAKISSLESQMGDLTKMKVRDARTEGNKSPQWYIDNKFLYIKCAELNIASNVGLTGNDLCHIETFIPWDNVSAGVSQKITINPTGEIYERRAQSATLWGNPRKLLNQDDYNNITSGNNTIVLYNGKRYYLKADQQGFYLQEV